MRKKQLRRGLTKTPLNSDSLLSAC
jgi:hypothetical protein